MRCRDCTQPELVDIADGVAMILWCRGVKAAGEWLTPPHMTRYRSTCKNIQLPQVPKCKKVNWKGDRL